MIRNFATKASWKKTHACRFLESFTVRDYVVNEKSFWRSVASVSTRRYNKNVIMIMQSKKDVLMMMLRRLIILASWATENVTFIMQVMNFVLIMNMCLTASNASWIIEITPVWIIWGCHGDNANQMRCDHHDDSWPFNRCVLHYLDYIRADSMRVTHWHLTCNA